MQERSRGERGTGLSGVRIRAVVLKELRALRRNRVIVVTMLVLPLIFLIIPIGELFSISAASPARLVRPRVGAALLQMLVVPVVVPATIAAYAVVGEREAGTLEPVLTTPIRRDEFILGKALAALIPSVTVAYALLLTVFLSVRFGAVAAVVSAMWQAPQILAQLLFVPLLATWSIWVGMAISARTSDVRVAQQLGTLASLPMLGVTVLIGFQVIEPSVLFAVVLGAILAAVDLAAWRLVSLTFDRERLIATTK